MLKVDRISSYYGNIMALNEISVEIKKGEIVAIIGNNGAGKTTLINTITGIINPKEGKITFNDKDITNLPTDKIVEMGIIHVPEGREIFSDLTAEKRKGTCDVC